MNAASRIQRHAIDDQHAVEVGRARVAALAPLDDRPRSARRCSRATPSHASPARSVAARRRPRRAAEQPMRDRGPASARSRGSGRSRSSHRTSGAALRRQRAPARLRARGRGARAAAPDRRAAAPRARAARPAAGRGSLAMNACTDFSERARIGRGQMPSTSAATTMMPNTQVSRPRMSGSAPCSRACRAGRTSPSGTWRAGRSRRGSPPSPPARRSAWAPGSSRRGPSAAQVLSAVNVPSRIRNSPTKPDSAGQADRAQHDDQEAGRERPASASRCRRTRRAGACGGARRARRRRGTGRRS